eukprot:SAG31_NODE_1093_length_9952_cov_16.099056_14_plen_93_part_00
MESVTAAFDKVLEYSDTAGSALRKETAKMPLVGVKSEEVLAEGSKATGLPENQLLVGVCGFLSLIVLLVLGLTNVVTVVAFGGPALSSIRCV